MAGKRSTHKSVKGSSSGHFEARLIDFVAFPRVAYDCRHGCMTIVTRITAWLDMLDMFLGVVSGSMGMCAGLTDTPNFKVQYSS